MYFCKTIIDFAIGPTNLFFMIKYIILSIIGYYIFVNYLSPLIEGQKESQKPENKNKNEDEYVDYEEIE